MSSAGRVGAHPYRPDPSVVDRAVRAIVQAYQPERVIVFGSFARGDTHEASDLDLIVVKETDERFFRRIGRVRYACVDVGVDVQPFVYTPQEVREMLERGSAFLETALGEGIVAYEAPPSEGHREPAQPSPNP